VKEYHRPQSAIPMLFLLSSLVDGFLAPILHHSLDPHPCDMSYFGNKLWTDSILVDSASPKP